METTTEQLDTKEVSQKKRKSRRIPKSIRPEEFKQLISEIPKKDNIAIIRLIISCISRRKNSLIYITIVIKIIITSLSL